MSAVLPWVMAILGALALLVLPGWGVLLLARVPMRRLYGVAPAVTLAMLTVIGVVCHVLGVRFEAWSVAVGCVLMLGLAAVLGRTAWRDPRPPAMTPADPRDESGAPAGTRGVAAAKAVAPALLAMVVGLGWAVPSIRAIGRIDELPQSFDAFFHLSAVRQLRETGDAFPLTALGPLYNTDRVTYPIGWHSVASLLPGDPTVAANGLVVTSLLLLPLTMLPLMDQALPPGRARRASLAALMFLPAFLTFPSLALRAGLWPYSLAIALLPALLAALLHMRHGRAADPHVSRSVVVLLAVIGGTCATHPAVAFALVLVAPVLVIDAIVQLREGATRRRGIVLLGLYGAAAMLLLAVSVSRFETMSTFFGRLSSNSPLMALGIVLTDRPAYQLLPFAPAHVLLPWVCAGIGILVGVRRRSAPVIGTTIGLSVVVLVATAALVPGPLGPLLTWPWYGDRERIGPVLAIGVVTLAGVGLQHLVVCAERRWQRSSRPWTTRVRASHVIAVVLVGLGATGTLTNGRTAVLAAATYHPETSPYKVYVSDQEERFIRETAATLPEDAVVLGDPRDGTTLYASLGDRAVVFSYLQPPIDVPRKRVARYAEEYTEVPRVCEALESTGVTHLYRDSSEDSGRSGASAQQNSEFSGVNSLDTSTMELVAQQGPYALYRFEVTC